MNTNTNKRLEALESEMEKWIERAFYAYVCRVAQILPSDEYDVYVEYWNAFAQGQTYEESPILEKAVDRILNDPQAKGAFSTYIQMLSAAPWSTPARR